jgi:cytochrome b561
VAALCGTRSHVVLYALMFALPLVGWGMLSAARYPIVLYGPPELPPILPHDVALYAVLRTAHTVLAFLIFATFSRLRKKSVGGLPAQFVAFCPFVTR